MGAYARRAPNQAMILSAFEEEGWPTRIDDPLPRGRLRQTLKDLQKKFKNAPLTFRANGTGDQVKLAHAPIPQVVPPTPGPACLAEARVRHAIPFSSRTPPALLP